ncbi:MAG: DNA primase noncatalytic subunit PriX [Thermosphaera sp.]
MKKEVKAFISFVKTWGRGHLGRHIIREIGLSQSNNIGFLRELVNIEAFENVFKPYIKTWGSLNWYMSMAFKPLENTAPFDRDNVFYDRLVFDFDSEDNPAEAVQNAVEFAKKVEGYGCTPLVVKSGFKGAHVVVFIKPLPWGEAEQLYTALSALSNKKHLDMNMKQWNRLARIPLTFNIKNGEARRSIIIYPKNIGDFSEFNIKDFQPLDPSAVLVEVFRYRSLPRLPDYRVKRADGDDWIWKIVEKGLPDGRKRFMLKVLIPRLLNVYGRSEEEVYEACKSFIDNSCTNHGSCSTIYDSWIRSTIRSATFSKFKGFGLKKIREADPELYDLIKSVL